MPANPKELPRTGEKGCMASALVTMPSMFWSPGTRSLDSRVRPMFEVMVSLLVACASVLRRTACRW